MGKHDHSKKNVSGWVTDNFISFPTALRHGSGGSLKGVSFEKRYARDVIHYAHEDFKHLLPDSYQTFTLPEFAKLIEANSGLDLSLNINWEVAEVIALMKMYPPEYVNSQRDTSRIGKLRSPHITAMIERFEKEKSNEQKTNRNATRNITPRRKSQTGFSHTVQHG